MDNFNDGTKIYIPKITKEVPDIKAYEHSLSDSTDGTKVFRERKTDDNNGKQVLR